MQTTQLTPKHVIKTPDGAKVNEKSSPEQSAIHHRDRLLSDTDALIILPDYPYKQELTAYRQALRDWPESETFPHEIPEAPKTENGKSIL